MIKIAKKENCTGCHGCYNVCPKKCIDMNFDEEGFLYPSVDSNKCVECGLCEKVCPIMHIVEVENEPIAIGCYNKDEKIRMESSSGGIFTLISELVIQSGGVVFGAEFDENYNVRHSYVDNIQDLHKFRGSKYVQSTIGNSYYDAKQFLEQGRQVLFSGTPCQIAGLKRYLQKDYDNLICQDIVCHGVPSIYVWEHYKNFIANGRRISSVKFRDKSTGWKTYSLQIDFDDGSSYKDIGNENSYIKGFVKDFYLRPSCYECKYKTLHRESDITLADFWGIEANVPELDDNKGTSLIFINSDKGRLCFEKIGKSIVFKIINIENAVTFNPSSHKPAIMTKKRDTFYKEYRNKNLNLLVDELLKQNTIHKLYNYISYLKIKIKNIL
ncbi:MAG: Coenzyme F420 hydrogenase/dehydrogenase, beta subunit C-terminal domain [Intestinibacter bartlettii]|uniref:Coenzyme F420 hydrogenase/dehydrogenase, beta subunit C-terminal domain n=1 Tax=Intestinibacter bartlettii TaxID=261299 RepID=UPI00290D4FA7|nr:Coenzyme F420 hydrogenase/dehydrogenase, beta subunit C-terminal domain [Intestinibacter bartlettii]MDU6198528.1 Coenzyme F420 hydrogenase/dehydrogenase, beta subunit C-terminal domain [Intestinibacter bartlettii]